VSSFKKTVAKIEVLPHVGRHPLLNIVNHDRQGVMSRANLIPAQNHPGLTHFHDPESGFNLVLFSI
jgi:hypothetical protein